MTRATGRRPDWMVRLDALVCAFRERPFAWGDHDCCTVAAAVVEACTGADVMGDLRGRYSTALGAARLIEAEGGMAAMLAARLGTEVAVSMAQAGDIGLGADGRLVWFGGAGWHGPGELGLVTTDDPVRVWRVHE